MIFKTNSTSNLINSVKDAIQELPNRNVFAIFPKMASTPYSESSVIAAQVKIEPIRPIKKL